MDEKFIRDLRSMLKEHLSKVYKLSLDLHKEQEKIEDILRIMDVSLMERT